jgi:biotin carboxyl carrier protein
VKRRILTSMLVLGVLAVVGGALLWSYLAHHAELASEAQSDQAIGTPSKAATEGGEPVVTFDSEVQKTMDIRTDTVATTTLRQQVVAYGHLEEDPSGSFILRAPLAGTVLGAAGRVWPNTGDNLADGITVGQVEPRLAPADRVTISDRAASAQGDVEAARASLSAAQAALARTRTLNADDKNVSDRAVQEAEARVATEQSRLNGAQQSVRLLSSALASSRDASITLVLARGGTVVDIMAHPGESVESGQPLLRVARLDKLVARVDLPAGMTVAPNLTSANIVPLGYEAKPLLGERMGFAAAVDPKTQGQPFIFRVTDSTGALRPGLSVAAYLETSGPARTGALVPRSAVLWQTGKLWVYVQVSKEKFARREIALEDPMAGGWFTRSLKPGDKIVIRGAQTLLSEEFKSQIQLGD